MSFLRGGEGKTLMCPLDPVQISDKHSDVEPTSDDLGAKSDRRGISLYK